MCYWTALILCNTVYCRDSSRSRSLCKSLKILIKSQAIQKSYLETPSLEGFSSFFGFEPEEVMAVVSFNRHNVTHDKW